MHNSRYRTFFHSRRHGYGMNLYRNTDEKYIAGVCAGLADHFEIDHSLMRILFILGFIFSATLGFWGYLAAWVLLSPKRQQRAEDISVEYDESRRGYRRKKLFRYPESSRTRIKRARERLDAVVKRVEAMEHYVTSSRYQLNKEFSNLEQGK